MGGFQGSGRTLGNREDKLEDLGGDYLEWVKG